MYIFRPSDKMINPADCVDMHCDGQKKNLLIDTDGTMGPHHARKFSQEVVDHINKMVDTGLKVAIYTNAYEDRFHQFQYIAVVTDVPQQPNRRGFEKDLLDWYKDR